MTITRTLESVIQERLAERKLKKEIVEADQRLIKVAQENDIRRLRSHFVQWFERAEGVVLPDEIELRIQKPVSGGQYYEAVFYPTPHSIKRRIRLSNEFCLAQDDTALAWWMPAYKGQWRGYIDSSLYNDFDNFVDAVMWVMELEVV